MNVFTYGSLMFDEVWGAVAGRIGPSVTGRLDGYEAWKLAGQTFPGLAPAAGHRVAGRIWRQVTAAELTKLDVFESGIYAREELPVLADNGDKLDCWVYVVRPECRTLLMPGRWDVEEFRSRYLAGFLRD